MNPALTINHQTGSYPIYIGASLFERCNVLFQDLIGQNGKHAVITDENVHELYGRSFVESLPFDVHSYICPAGEGSKSFAHYERILNELLEAGLDRHSWIIALGGGVPGDLAGFVAASYMRGLRFVQIPTTLLAQVDSSVGGKTGINMPMAKNSVGAFWQPEAVFIDPGFLKTLDQKEYTSGLAEVVKYGVIMDEPFFGFLEENAASITARKTDTLEAVIKRCCELKAQVVEEDERETSGRRAILNYGHTFGHALESVYGYGTHPHGHAVAMGMQAAANLSLLMGRANNTFVERQSALLDALKIPCRFPADRHEELYEAMQHDKKSVSGKARFILADSLGSVELVDAPDKNMVMEAMKSAALSG